jgi:FAD/FMN-containing dehydrogenase
MAIGINEPGVDTQAPPGGTAATGEALQKVQELQARFPEWVTLDDAARERYRSDYGRWTSKVPGAVARPRTTEQVAELVRFCRAHGVTITPRAQGHSQSGQSTNDGGVLLDITGMNEIFAIDGETMLADVQGGVVWRDLVAATCEHNLVPRVLTNNLGVCVAGTVSVAGIGVASFRYGLQADNVAELEVVTGTGDVVVCSRESNRDLFDVVRCGFGQFGVITRAKVMLRRCKPRVRMYHLLYDDLGAFMRDAERIMDPDDSKYHSLESRSAPCLIFTKRIGDGIKLAQGMQTYAYWMYPLFLTVEYEPGEEVDDAAFLEGLRYYKRLETVEYSQNEFCNRLEPIFELWQRAGAWEMAHPWMEVILPWDKAQEYIELAQSNLPPQALGAGGHVLLWPAYTGTSDAPLFMHPPGKFLMGWGILPSVPERFLDQALSQLEMASELAIAFGGKRYLSGYITFDTPERWAAHFGDEWPRVLAAKGKYDPDGILSPGFIQYA